MKHIKVCFLFLSILFIFNSCEENGIFFPVYENNAIFQATFDGETFLTSEANFTVEGDDLFINAIDVTTNESFTLRVDNYDLGVFSFEGLNTVATYAENASNSSDVWTTFSETASRGTIDITNIDYVYNTISGSFNFIGRNSISGSSKAFLSGTFSEIPKGEFPIGNTDFSAKIDGFEYEDISLFANLVTIGNNKLITIDANKSATESISLTVPYNVAVGEYDFGTFAAQTYPTAQYIVNGIIYEADGKIRIISHNTTTNTISGTFEFSATTSTSANSFSITEGQFKLSY
ncbi:hypothetical protein BW723_03075 [Polaribacter reichenbachii]|uniref:Uncharacterized protein n=1 Tax=Polaribacter reichenbachii TaxID=996801 RepID=A0A1B8TVK8_9FLAO|nr:DUF6252 family protein [Polaribacter reichenbachii]APZ45344.1 hypothetical protein BW723_03075 [Polaribacter reichenbachii]AUC19205.1 hypothetical protein BTO17_11080 [Polaribacter reichenbachii]OBY63638.1 hypothetical protein LPB301_12625 [Polaribacter reichenbachii]